MILVIICRGQATIESLRTREARDLRPMGMGYQCPEISLGRSADYVAPTAMTCWAPDLSSACTINDASVCINGYVRAVCLEHEKSVLVTYALCVAEHLFD
jgi:hypothetical protein